MCTQHSRFEVHTLVFARSALTRRVQNRRMGQRSGDHSHSDGEYADGREDPKKKDGVQWFHTPIIGVSSADKK